MAGVEAEAKLSLVMEFLNAWRDFFQRFESGMTAAEVTPDMEADFLKAESRIAMRRQVLEHVLGKPFTCGADVIRVLVGCVSLDQLQNESPIVVNTLKSQWHEVLIALNKTVGNLKEEVAIAAEKKKKK